MKKVFASAQVRLPHKLKIAKPRLLVIAGCNGSGKSTYSKLLAPSGFLPFDYDRYFLQYYKSLLDSDFRETMAHNMAFEELERQVSDAINSNSDFCYETNFNSTPLFWPAHFKEHGYKLHLIYLCLNSIGEAKRRVAIRVENGGHFVSEEEISKRYFDGFTNLNDHFRYFDIVDIFDTSAYCAEPKHIFSIENNVVVRKYVPAYLNTLAPDLLRFVKG